MLYTYKKSMSISRNSNKQATYLTKTTQEIDWNFVKENIFVEDGSYRDVYIENIDKEKWYKLVDYFFTKKLIGYSHIYIEESSTYYYEMPINWKELLQKTNSAWFFNVSFLKGNICFHHFTDEQIEATVNPIDIQSIEDFFKLIDFLDDTVNLLKINGILPQKTVRIIF